MPHTLTTRAYDQRGWHDRRTATPDPRVVIVWVTCDRCWGQRIVIKARRRYLCRRCLGIGQRMTIKES